MHKIYKQYLRTIQVREGIHCPTVGGETRPEQGDYRRMTWVYQESDRGKTPKSYGLTEEKI